VPKELTPEQMIIKAAKAGNLPAVQQLLAAAPELASARDESGATALHFAAWRGYAEIVAALLDAGAEVTAQWQDGHVGGTPLHAAAHGNQRAIAELLIARGADVNATSCNGRSVMQETTLHNAKAVANLLRKHGVAG
jgi:ankyrin repeat protein